VAKSKILNATEEAALEIVKTTIHQNIQNANPLNILQVACDNFKFAFERAIQIAGARGKQSLTTSSKHINLFHEVVKSELIRNGVKPELVFPPQYNSSGEINFAGFIKAKKQDICAVPTAFIGKEIPEIISVGMMTGKTDGFGKDYTENSLVINIRSQMSSIGKNNDTIVERAFAETLNLHKRCPKMVLGEFFILPTTGFNMDEVKKKNPVFELIITTKANRRSKTTAESIEKSINTYASINSRDITKGEEYKYERLCLILADFSQTPVRIYKNDADLNADNLLPAGSSATLNGLGYDYFISDLMAIYSTRFGTGKFS